MRRVKLSAALMALLAVSACKNANDIALQVGAQPTDAPGLRGFEIRDLATANDAAILQSATATLQDLGFTVTESAPQAGVLAGTKARDATTTGQVAGAIVLGVLFGASAMRYDKTQQINVTFVVSPASSTDHRITRVSFDRYMTNNQNQLWRTQLVTDPKVYQQFYEDLDKAIALDKGARS